MDRNRIKRLLREVYRLNKNQLHTTITEKQLHFFVLFIDKNLPENYQAIEPKMQHAIDKLIKYYNNERAV